MILSKQKNKLFSLFQALFVRPSRNRRKFFVLGTLVILLFLFIPRPAYAFIGGELVIAVLWAILTVCKLFVSLAAMLLAFMLRGDIYYFSNEPVILIGWKICRDVCNLFFLLILIFIAFCTILQIEKYHAKKTLLTLIIMALLINFSKPIAIFIFDGSQLLMNYFLNSTGDYTSKVTELSKITDIVYNNLPKWYERWSYRWTWDFDMVVMQITSIIFMFMYAVALIVMAIYLFIRLVALWILIIVSPFAFLFAVVPDFKKYADEWWSALFKYCYVGPILAFFLYLSTQLASSAFLKTAENDQRTVMTENILTLGNAVHFIVVLVFLYASIIMAQKFGIAFAGGITSTANKALKWGTGVTAAKWGGRKAWQGTKYAAKAGLKMAERKWLMPHGLSPRANWQAWKERSEEVDRQALSVASGKSRDTFHRHLDNTETNYEQLAVDRVKAEEMKRYKEHSEDFSVLGGEMGRLIGSDMRNAPEKLSAILRIAYSNRDQDEIVGFIRNNWDTLKLGNGQTFEQLFTANGMTKDDMVVEGHAVSNIVDTFLRSTQKTNANYINKELSDLGQVAAGNGGIGFGATKRDSSGKLQRTSKDEQAFMAAKKHQTVFEPQQRAQRTHRNWETDEVNADHINEQGAESLRWKSMADVEQVNRTSPSMLEQSGTNIDIAEDVYHNLAAMRDGNWHGHEFKLWDSNLKASVAQHDSNQAYIAATHRAAMQAMAGVEKRIIKDQLTRYGFDLAKINERLDQAKSKVRI
ncbi:MAG: type IV secretion system protein [Candidatus Moranbacteria bacterium]|nr:type IV secretion system protein [Candidatus Moranbacteria bacterium]